MHANFRTAILAAFSLFFPAFSFAQAQQTLLRDSNFSRGARWFQFGRSYSTPDVPVVDFSNSPRLDRLVQNGKLHLSLSDAIALAIENNLDIATARYGPQVADSDILRAKAGAQLRGVQTQIGTLSTGVSAQAAQPAGGGQATGITGRAGGGGIGGLGGDGAGNIGAASTFFGSALPNLDPTISGRFLEGQFSNPQTSNFVTGTTTFITEATQGGVNFNKAFLTGTSLSLSLNSNRTETNSIRANFNPSVTSSLTLQVRQPLLQGFGIAVNSRNIKVAKNNRKVSDLSFKQQVIQTVAQVQNLYWDLVSFEADVRGRQEDLRLARKTYEDNKRRVEIGTLAPIEIVRAEAEVAAREQDLTLAITRVRQQETVLKNAISKNGPASPSLMEVDIVPMDRIEVPETEEIRPVQDLMQEALNRRPEVLQSRLQFENRDIQLKGVRNAMLPTVDLVGDLTNNGLGGQVNEDFQITPGQEPFVSPFFLGGFGTSLGQVFRRNFPDWSVQVQVRVPLKNRQAQADMAATLLEKRQARINLRQLENTIRVEVQNALIGLEQARARYEAAVKQRVLQERTLEAEQKKFDLGASTLFLVVQAQRDLAVARAAEVSAENEYVKAGVELDRATGATLSENNIVLEEAYEGRVSRAPDPLPPPDGGESQN